MLLNEGFALKSNAKLKNPNNENKDPDRYPCAHFIWFIIKIIRTNCHTGGKRTTGQSAGPDPTRSFQRGIDARRNPETGSPSG